MPWYNLLFAGTLTFFVAPFGSPLPYFGGVSGCRARYVGERFDQVRDVTESMLKGSSLPSWFVHQIWAKLRDVQGKRAPPGTLHDARSPEDASPLVKMRSMHKIQTAGASLVDADKLLRTCPKFLRDAAHPSAAEAHPAKLAGVREPHEVNKRFLPLHG